MIRRGVTYVAWNGCIEEAERSARSAKKFGLETCLIAPSYRGDAFDRVVQTRRKLLFPAEKVFVYHLSPWDETLYLDSDTIVLGELTFGFEMARRYGIALVIAPGTYVKDHWDLEDEDIPDDLTDYNGGVIFFNKKHPVAEGLWQALRDELGKIDWMTQKENPRYNDQSALSVLLHRKGINPYVLPQNWNLRPHLGMKRGHGPIKIWHSASRLPRNLDAGKTGRWRVYGKKGAYYM
jgi:hypothetical protein